MVRKLTHRTSALFIAAILLAAGIAQPVFAVTSTFTSNDEGWTIVSFSDLSVPNYAVSGTYAPTFHSTGGNPGGYIGVDSDPDSGDFTFSAPAAYLGDKSAALNTSLTYDLAYFTTANYQTTDVMLVSGTTRLVWNKNPAIIPTSTFTTITVPLNPTADWHVGSTSGALATNTDFTTVLSNLTGLFIRGEYAFGSDNTAIDNVNMVPEPTSIFLAGLAIGGAGMRRRRSTK